MHQCVWLDRSAYSLFNPVILSEKPEYTWEIEFWFSFGSFEAMFSGSQVYQGKNLLTFHALHMREWLEEIENSPKTVKFTLIAECKIVKFLTQRSFGVSLN